MAKSKLIVMSRKLEPIDFYTLMLRSVLAEESTATSMAVIASAVTRAEARRARPARRIKLGGSR